MDSSPPGAEVTVRWGEDADLFGPRHHYRVGLLVSGVRRRVAAGALVVDAASGLGTLSRRLAAHGYRVVGVDASYESCLLHSRASRRQGVRTWTVVGDIGFLPLASGIGAGLVSGETLEHLADDAGAAREFARVLADDGRAFATVPAFRKQWSAWDDWARHLRRYERGELASKFRAAGFACVRERTWGFPLARLYDRFFLLPLIRSRRRAAGNSSAFIGAARNLGRHRWLVKLVSALFHFDRVCDGSPWGVGLYVEAAKSLPNFVSS